MKHTFILLLLIKAFNLNAQNSDTLKSDDEIYMHFYPQMPEYIGGTNALFEYLQSTINYPQQAIDSCVSGIVYVKFIVKSDGSVSNAAILRGIGYGCDEEALNAVNSMPLWIPGEKNGEPIDILYNIPVKFALKNDCVKK